MASLTPVDECRETASHEAHMELNGECPWCLDVDPDQSVFGRIDERTGTVYAASGDVLETGPFEYGDED